MLAPPALSLLRCLLNELLGYRLPLSHVPRLAWFAFLLSTIRQ